MFHLSFIIIISLYSTLINNGRCVRIHKIDPQADIALQPALVKVGISITQAGFKIILLKKLKKYFLFNVYLYYTDWNMYEYVINT